MSYASGRHFLQIPGPTNIPDRILRAIDRPIIDHQNTVQIVGTGPSAEAAIEDASRGAVDFVASRTELSRRDAYMLLGIVGDVRIGTSPRPVMAARVIIDKDVLRSAGWNGDVLARAG
jgi:acetamidase/formamidase